MKNYKFSLSYNTFDKKDFSALKKSINLKKYTMGKTVEKFENKLSKWLNIKNAVMVNSGSSANLLLMSSLLYKTKKKNIHLKKGDEILVPALAWPTTIWPIVQLGLKPVIVDINLKSLAIDLESANQMITKKTKAMFLIHVLGQACEMKKYINFCKKNKIILLEDCCESFGAFYNNKTVGSFGYGGTLSHYFSHHLTTIEGGTVITNDDDLANDLRSLRSHGWIRDRTDFSLFKKKYSNLDSRWLFLLPGFNFRPMEFQAVLGLEQLKKVDIFLKKKEEFVCKIKDLFLNGPSWLKIIGSEFIGNKIVNRNQRSHSWMFIPFLIDHPKFNFNDIIKIFERNSIETRPIISGNITKHPVFENLNAIISKNLTNTNIIHEKGFLIGCYPVIKTTPIKQLQKTLNELKRL